MKEVSVRGTLGDTYIALLKIKAMNQSVIVYHHTKHTYWYKQISEIYGLYANVEVKFVDEPRLDLEEVTSDCHEGDMEFFPMFDIYDNFHLEKPYKIIQPHSGKIVGHNSKRMSALEVNEIIRRSPDRCVLLGIDTDYISIGNCINLVGKTSIHDSLSLIQNCDEFIGPEGLLSFIALSQKKLSTIYYIDIEAVNKRILGTPWGKYSNPILRVTDILGKLL